ncbi:MAG TPA: hypothetical protein VFK88_05295 [Gallionella sp.]|nr:hypothetical protein [Gallionella sp.]
MTFWVAGAALVGAGVSAYSSNKASKAQQQSVSDANAESARQYDQTRADQQALLAQQRADQQPWLEAGKASLAQLAAGTSPGGALVRPFSMADFQADPGYGFRISEGEKGIQRAASAHGGLYSGATLKALSRFNQDTASGEYGNAYNRYNNNQSNDFNRLASIAGLGQTATNQVGQAGQNAYGTIANSGMNASNNISQNMIGAGNARASGYVGAANSLNNGLSQYMNYSQNRSLLDKLSSNSNVGGYGDEMARINAQLYSGG